MRSSDRQDNVGSAVDAKLNTRLINFSAKVAPVIGSIMLMVMIWLVKEAIASAQFRSDGARFSKDDAKPLEKQVDQNTYSINTMKEDLTEIKGDIKTILKNQANKE